MYATLPVAGKLIFVSSPVLFATPGTSNPVPASPTKSNGKVSDDKTILEINAFIDASSSVSASSTSACNASVVPATISAFEIAIWNVSCADCGALPISIPTPVFSFNAFASTIFAFSSVKSVGGTIATVKSYTAVCKTSISLFISSVVAFALATIDFAESIAAFNASYSVFGTCPGRLPTVFEFQSVSAEVIFASSFCRPAPADWRISTLPKPLAVYSVNVALSAPIKLSKSASQPS